jgi:hypothetical protein
MSSGRRIVTKVVGMIQCVLGGIASVFAFFVYASSQLQEALAITSREVSLYMFLFSVLGILSIISGMLFLREENGG